MTELSPRTQAVLAAYLYGGLSAALQAAADQIKPHISHTPWITNEDGYFNETFENYEALGQLEAHDHLLAIAAELEGGND